MQTETFVPALANELAAAIGAPLGGGVTLAAAAAPGEIGSGWLADAELPGAGRIRVWFDLAGASAFTAAALGMETADSAAVTDHVHEILAQALAAVALHPECTGLTAGSAAVTSGAAPAGPAWFRGEIAASGPCSVAILFEAAAAAAIGAPAPDGADVQSERLQALLSVELPLVARFGSVVLPMKRLAGLAPGAIVDIHRSPDDPVELLVGERVIAFGEVVIVSGNYGVRITEITDNLGRSADRMEARR